jgi:hypothetical protein
MMEKSNTIILTGVIGMFAAVMVGAGEFYYILTL